MSFESALPPENRHFNPRVGWYDCPHCHALFQAPLYDENNDFYQDEATAASYMYSHVAVCTSQDKYLDDPNAYYPNLNNSSDPEPKCYFESCNY